MYVERIAIAVTTDGSGNATAYSAAPVTGAVKQVRYVPDGSVPLDTGADIAITGETSGVQVLSQSNIGTSAFASAPRQATHLASDGSAALYADTGEPVLTEVVVAQERIKIVVSSGGSAKSGTFYVYVG